MTKPSLAHTTNIDTLLAGADNRQELSVPPETTQDRVFFIFNNLSQMNMQQKVDASQCKCRFKKLQLNLRSINKKTITCLIC